MAMTVSASIQLIDMMTEPIQHINNVLNVMLAGLASVDTATDTAFNAEQIGSMQNELAEVDTQLTKMVELTNKEKKAQDAVNASAQSGVPIFENLKSKIVSIAGAYIGLQGIKKGVEFYKESIEGANVQIEAERKLETITRQRMGATEEQINAIKQLTATQQGLGVVGDEVQMGGAQQLATFLNTSDALNTLIPAMNNLAVQQNGVNVTSENMASIGNMMGKVMQGQTSALTRVGITFTEAQEKALKYGTEQERAATLAQIITDNVGEMNAAMANTPQGQIQQISNTWGDMKEVVGMQLYPAVLSFFSAVNTNLPTMEPILRGITGLIGGMVTVLGGAVSMVGAVASAFVNNWSWLQYVIYGVIAAIIVYNATMGVAWLSTLTAAAATAWKAICDAASTVALIAMTIAQNGLNAALLACPITWIIIGIIALIAIIFAVCAAIAKFTGIANSAFGVICGVVATAGAFIWNLFVALINAIIQLIWATFVTRFIGIIEWILNVCNGGFDSFGDAVANLVGQIISWFLDLGKVVTEIIDAIFGTDWTAGLNSLQDSVIAWGKNDSAITLSREAPMLNRIEYSGAFSSGVAFGDGMSDKVSGLLGGLFDGGDFGSDDKKYSAESAGSQEGSNLSSIASGSDKTAKNTEKIAKNTEKTNSLIELVKDNREREAVARYTAKNNSYTFDFSNMSNNYNNTSESFNFVKELEKFISSKMEASPEGI